MLALLHAGAILEFLSQSVLKYSYQISTLFAIHIYVHETVIVLCCVSLRARAQLSGVIGAAGNYCFKEPLTMIITKNKRMLANHVV